MGEGGGRSDEAQGVDGGVVRDMGGEPSLRRDVGILGALSLDLFLAPSSSPPHHPFPFYFQFHGNATTASTTFIRFLDFLYL